LGAALLGKGFHQPNQCDFRTETKKEAAKAAPRFRETILASFPSLLQISLIGSIPLVNLLLSCVFRDTIPLLNLSNQLVVLSIDDVKVIVGQLAPAFLYRPFDLLPLALHLVRIHSNPPWYFIYLVRAAYRSRLLMRTRSLLV
jgi:hypothetical protein